MADIFPSSSQVRLVGLAEADDRTLWDYAKENGFIRVSQDSDFAEMATLFGPPPKVVWVRSGNQPTDALERLLRKHAEAIDAFGADQNAACLELY